MPATRICDLCWSVTFGMTHTYVEDAQGRCDLCGRATIVSLYTDHGRKD